MTVAPEAFQILQPERPSAIKVENARYQACPGVAHMVCVTAADARNQILNKVKLSEYIGRLNNIVDYYESATKSEPQSD